ncbi:hypothetical protein [Klebsiella pneumoniae]|uniref:hypothetical protein n=1 Tax=Klebsiella pneumoniae TaxID=573 RepID=UPI000F61F2BE|nr:hypothetical protein [Klebsiella pneumoniae]
MKTFGTLLIGAGHAHLEVLRHWVDVGAVRRCCFTVTFAMPGIQACSGLLAGRYQSEQCRIPLSPLCLAAGVTLMQGKMIALDAQTGRVSLEDGRLLQGNVCPEYRRGIAFSAQSFIRNGRIAGETLCRLLIRLAHWQRHPGSRQ